MSITTTTSQSWFGRIGNAFKGILVGILLALVAVPLLFWNEGRAVHRAKTLAQGRDLVVADVPVESVDPALEGKLVHMIGTAESQLTLADDQFGISVDQALSLRRRVEMYQWREDKRVDTKKKLGGGTEQETTYTYEQVWSTQAIDSNHFNARGKSVYGSGNPAFAVTNQDWFAKPVTLGAFELSEDQVRQIGNYQPVAIEALPDSLPGATTPQSSGDDPPDEASSTSDADSQDPESSPPPSGSIPVEIIDESGTHLAPAPGGANNQQDARGGGNAQYHLQGNVIYRGEDPNQPQIGDLRITFESVGPTEISLIYQQTGNQLIPYKFPSGSIALLATGRKSAEQMIQDAEAANTMLLWMLRLAGFVIMAVGIGMVLRPLAVIGDVVPLVGNLVGVGIAIVALLVAGGLSLVTISIAWLFYRPLLGISLLVASVVLFWLARRFLRSRSQQVVDVDQPVVLD